VRLYRSDDHKQNFLDCIRSRKPTVAPPETAHHSIGAAYLGIIAMRLARPLRWDGLHERFPDDEEATRMLSRPMREPLGGVKHGDSRFVLSPERLREVAPLRLLQGPLGACPHLP